MRPSVVALESEGLWELYRVHTSNKGKVCRGIISSFEQYAVPLGSSEIKHICLRSLSVDTINLNNLHGVALKPEVLASKSRHVDDAEHIGFPRFNR